MKKTMLISVLLMFTLSIYSQTEIGQSKDQILKAIPEITWKESETNDGFPFIYFVSMNVAKSCYLDNNGKCIKIVLLMMTNEAQYDFIKYYNKTYITKDNFTWWIYQKNIIIEIKLTYDNNEAGKFTFKKIKDLE